MIVKCFPRENHHFRASKKVKYTIIKKKFRHSLYSVMRNSLTKKFLLSVLQLIAGAVQNHEPSRQSESNAPANSDSQRASRALPTIQTSLKRELVLVLEKHARSVSKNEHDITRAAHDITEIGETNYEKTKLIYLWLTENISYDKSQEGFRKMEEESTRPENVIISKTAASAGFAKLAEAFGNADLKL